MARYHEPYSLYQRKMRSGLVVFYYRTYSPDTGKRSRGLSTGKASMRDAVLYCEGLLERGELIPSPKAPRVAAVEVRRSRRPPTLKEWAAERHWWQWPKPEEGAAIVPSCLYCLDNLNRSEDGAPAIQRETADKNYRVLRDNILPFLGDKRIDLVSVEDCEAMLRAWKAEGKAHKTINNRASVARVMFNEAARLRIIPSSPWEGVDVYHVDKHRQKKGILGLGEYKALMHPANAARLWAIKGGHLDYYRVSLLASVTGLRMSECLALKKEDVAIDHITVSVKWRISYGEGPQKTKRGTDNLPIPRFLGEMLVAIAKGTPEGKYIFSRSGGDKPLTANRACDALYLALDRMGVKDDPEKDRKDEAGNITRPAAAGSRQARGITEHSWRAFANTYFLDRGIDKSKVQELTRHESDEMTAHYRAWSPESFSEIAKAQDELVKALESDVI